MDYENDDLKFQYLAGGNFLEYPPIYSKDGEYLLFMIKNVVKVYSTISFQFVRKLEGSTAPLIDFEFELGDDNILISCNNNGEIFSWEWKTGVLKNTLRIPDINYKPRKVTNFKLLNIYGKSNLAHAFICSKPTNSSTEWRVLNREDCTYLKVPCDLRLGYKQLLMVVDNKNFPYLVLAQNHYLYIVNYKQWTSLRLMNAHQVPITALQIHPREECIATGDEQGKIFLWRNFYIHEMVKTSLYHWHHTKVTSICFTISGSSFYSSGQESVLVKWNVESPNLRNFMPRLAAEIRHTVVSPDNTRVVACLNDNSVQFYGTDGVIYQNLQDFAYIADDKTENCKYPIGFRLNPRNNSLVLNGRIGSLQFYNTYTKSLLYNLNIVNQNLLSTERDAILYDITVTKAAFNINWMATGEVFNDQEHLPEMRLKFWKYQEETQNYALNTNIELPHEGGFKAIEFSNAYQVDNLLCATVGEDNIIKMWSLDESDNIYKTDMTWYCIAQTSYKDLPLDSISFSQDGSLLAAGYGNTLCIYKSDNLKLKAALTGANGLDGCIAKAQIRVPSKNINTTKSELVEKRKRLMQLFANMFETNEETLITELQKTLKENTPLNKHVAEPLDKLDDDQKTSLYKKIIQLHELNLSQKVLLYQKLGISCKVHPQVEAKFKEYLSKLIDKNKIITKLTQQTHRLNFRQRFKATYRLHQHCKEQIHYDKIARNLVPLLSLMNLGKTVEPTNQKPQKHFYKKSIKNAIFLPPKPTMAEISHVQFTAGEYAHLVVVCTERRVLIWNLLTLRLQSVLKLSAKHLTFDPQTNLLAVVTHSRELHLFQPNVPLPIYQRQNLPNVYGIAWIPRRYPKQRSINLDWQAQSTLYFLNEDQEIIYLSSSNGREPDHPEPIAFDNAATNSINYTTFGTFATKSVTDKQTITSQNGPLVLGNNEKAAVKSLMDMSIHTMPPMSLICEDFIKSMVKCNDSKAVNDALNHHSNTDDDVLSSRLNGGLNGFASHSDDEDENGGITVAGATPMTNGFSAFDGSAKKIRKDLLKKTEELKQQSLDMQSAAPAGKEDVENKLRCMARQDLNLYF